ncbi:MAG: rhodanese-like domain-containing protein [Oscillospiraceae bacterium]|nr:rhodanese-like domain-containing protein [Oscillospiraceae bacterium]
MKRFILFSFVCLCAGLVGGCENRIVTNTPSNELADESVTNTPSNELADETATNTSSNDLADESVTNTSSSDLADESEKNKLPAAVYQRITAEEAMTMMEDGDPYILVDVRTKDEYETQRIEGAVLIPVDVIADRSESELPDKNARILIYCRSGNRSATAAKILVGLGYSNVFDFGGIASWTYGTISG